MSTSATFEPAVNYLVPAETIVETPGASPAYELALLAGKRVLIVLRITEIIEQESLHVSVWGSADGKDWGAKALFWYPEEFYCGVTPAALNLRQRPEIKFLQARWEVNRWGRGYPRPFFKIAVEIQELANGKPKSSLRIRRMDEEGREYITPGIDKRLHRRAKLITEVRCETLGREEILVTRDVSVGGLFISSKNPFPADSEVTLSLRLGPKDPTISYRGKVAYAVQGVGIGVQFVDLSEESLQALQKFVDESN